MPGKAIHHNGAIAQGFEVVIAQPRGFCAGVERAISIVERALELHGKPIYVRHEIVHNKYVVDDLRKKGAVFVDQLSEVPAGSTLIFSAHGVSQAVREEAERHGLKVFERDILVGLEYQRRTGGWVKVRHRDGPSGFVRANQIWGL